MNLNIKKGQQNIIGTVNYGMYSLFSKDLPFSEDDTAAERHGKLSMDPV